MDSAPLLAHILSQTRQNVEFLMSQNQLSPDVGHDILAKIPIPPVHTSAAAATSLVHQTQGITLSPKPSTKPSTPAVTPSPVSTPYHPPQPSLKAPLVVQARALWNYNEHGQDPNDLSFHAGDVIEIVAETNADWWTGKHQGRQALFPSNYVEKLPPSALPSPAPTPYSEKVQAPGGGIGFPDVPAYTPTYQPTGGYQGPPPPAQGYNPYGGPPHPAAGPPAMQGAPIEPQQPPKKNKFGGKLGSTLAHSAVGGVGFGAGSAVGSGIINSIF